MASPVTMKSEELAADSKREDERTSASDVDKLGRGWMITTERIDNKITPFHSPIHSLEWMKRFEKICLRKKS